MICYLYPESKVPIVIGTLKPGIAFSMDMFLKIPWTKRHLNIDLNQYDCQSRGAISLSKNNPADNTFFRFWFKGWQHGIEEMDETSRSALLKQCAKACAHSHTVQLFQDARASGSDLNSFVECLRRLIPHANYELKNKNEIRVTYDQCGCDLVTMGLVNSPLLCECSAYNLKENLEQSLRQPVDVKMVSSILRGDEQCILVAKINPAHN